MENCISGLVIISCVLLVMALFIGVCIYLVCSPVKTRRLNEIFSNEEARERDPEDKASEPEESLSKTGEEKKSSAAPESKGEASEGTAPKVDEPDATKLLNAVKDAISIIKSNKENMGVDTIVFVNCPGLKEDNAEYLLVLDKDAEEIAKLTEKPLLTMAISEKESVTMLLLDDAETSYCTSLLAGQEMKFTCIR